VAFTLKRCESLDNGITFYVVGEPAPYLFDMQDKYHNTDQDDEFGVLRLLKTMNKLGRVRIKNFRNDGDAIREEGDGTDHVTALYYPTIPERENKFRVYCIWPVSDNVNIVILGGGGSKEHGGNLKNYPECNAVNERMRMLSKALDNGLANGTIKIVDDRLIGGNENIIINN
jgi:hypothetical protein